MKVTVEKVPSKKKFAVDCNDFVVEPCEDHMLMLTWSPTDPAGVVKWCCSKLIKLIDFSLSLSAKLSSLLNLKRYICV